MKSYSNFKFWRDDLAKFISKKNTISEKTFPIEEEFNWNTWWIHLDRYKGEGKKTKVILVHGLGTNGRLMSIYAVPLNKAGYEVLIPDLPGFGLSDFEKHKITYEHWVSCISDLVKAEKSKDGSEIVVLGIGTGGIFAYDIASRNKEVSGLAVTAFVDFNNRAHIEKMFKNKFIWKNLDKIVDFLHKFEKDTQINISKIIKYENLTSQYSFSKKLTKDRLSGAKKVSVKFIYSLLNYKTRISPENFKTSKVLLMIPEQDVFTSTSLTEEFYEKLTCEKRKVVLEKSGHIPFETPGIRQLEENLIGFLEQIEKNIKAPEPERTLYAANF